jgi:hypothetical protein
VRHLAVFAAALRARPNQLFEQTVHGLAVQRGFR